MAIYFKVLNEGYVQNGDFAVTKQYKEGLVHVQGLELVIGNTPFKTLPENFHKTYNQFVDVPDPNTVDPETMFDRAAYNVAVQTDNMEVKMPVVKLVTFLYMFDTNGTRPSRTLMAFEGSEAQLRAQYPDLANGKLFTQAEFWEAFGDSGYSRYGTVLPRGISKALVDELRIVQGNFVDTDGTTVANINLYVSPLWIYNARPTFDTVYLIGEAAAMVQEGFDPNAANLAPRIVRWKADLNEGNRAFINFVDQSNGADFASRFGSNPYGTRRVDINLQIDGEEILNAEAYNVSNTRTS